jgi:signal transduction histidine kinase/DNA-binding response OmpR family regulator
MTKFSTRGARRRLLDGARRNIWAFATVALVVGMGALGVSAMADSRAQAEAVHRSDRLVFEEYAARAAGLGVGITTKSAFDFAQMRPWTMVAGDADDRSALEDEVRARAPYGVVGVMLLDMRLQLVNSASLTTALPSLDDPAYAPMLTALRTGASAPSNVLRAGDAAVFAVAAPVLGSPPVPRGVLVLLLEAATSPLQDTVESGARGRIRILDAAGAVVVSSQRDETGEQIADGPVLAALGRRESGVMEVRAHGRATVAVYASVVDGWGVLAEEPVEEFYGPIRAHATRAQWALLVALGIAIGGVALAFHKRSSALRRMAEHAEEGSRLKSEFLATMSHEIRTPMNGVVGLTGLLLDSALTETQRDYAEGVRASGEALLGIINDILDFSKIEAGKLQLETVDFELTHALEDVASLISQSANARGLELVTDCSPDLPTALRGDVGRLRQILLNFATNAVKFTPSGEVVLRAGVAGEPTDAGVTVRFEVTDTGVGVDPATAARLFDPFAQADASTTRRYGGTGLGLAICRRLAEAMGGTVGMDSRPGAGSTFWLLLPLARASAPVAARSAAGRSLEGCRALVVDDNQTNRIVLASQLLAWNMTADVAADASIALDRFRHAAAEGQPYDLAVVDMAMPGMDGLELARLVSADPALSSVGLVLLSSVAVEAAEAAAAGFAVRLTKPARRAELHDALASLVGLPAAALPPAPRAPGVLRTAGSKGRLLIAEDNAINQAVARGMVARLGYECDVAVNGIEVLEALERRQYDAVLMDCQMPEMDGYQATHRIRAGGDTVPIIAMTAGAMTEDRERCLAAGMDDYLAKPVGLKDLDRVLSRWAPAPGVGVGPIAGGGQ